MKRVTRPHRWSITGLVVIAFACGGDPYERYAASIQDDIVAARADAFQMTSRIQRTVVHNQIPADSFPVVAQAVSRAARTVRDRATHFARVTPPPDLAPYHQAMSEALTQMAVALDSLATVFDECARPGGTPCQEHLDRVSRQFEFVGEDVSNGKTVLQRMLLRHGVMLR
ncbi:MAG TPA: hypothetical protein VG454_02695 [Gemmatimonadales bacterium]|nr:hypothetical protein [Gemmatimonadales bacterium]